MLGTILTIVCIGIILWDLYNAAKKGWGAVAWYLVTLILGMLIIYWIFASNQNIFDIIL